MQIHFINQPYDLRGKILLISTSRLSLCTLDQVILQHKYLKIGYLDSCYLTPSVGYLPQSLGGALGLPGQLYGQNDTVILQLRSPICFGRNKYFAEELAVICKFFGILATVVLGTLPFDARPDREILMQKSEVYYKTKGMLPPSIQLQQCVAKTIIQPISVLRDEDQTDENVLEFSKVGQTLFKCLENVSILLMFAEERREDKVKERQFAIKLADIVNLKELYMGKVMNVIA